VFKNEKRYPLTPMELSLLKMFLGHAHEVITRERLLNEVWGVDTFPTTRTIDTFLLRLRHKIEQDPRRPVHFLTVHGAGYKFVP
jgi:DNA-binding response OmpR family regulator